MLIFFLIIFQSFSLKAEVSTGELLSSKLAFSTQKINFNDQDCHLNHFKKENTFNKFLGNTSSVLSRVNCEVLKKSNIERFSAEYCALSSSCSQKISMENLNSSFMFPVFISNDYVDSMLAQELPRMEKMETLRRFSVRNSEGLDSSLKCGSPFNYEKLDDLKKCNPDYITNGLNKLKDECGSKKRNCNEKENELQKEIEVFSGSFKPTAGVDENIVNSFFIKKADKKANEALAVDKEIIEALSFIMASHENKEIKIQKLFNKIYELKKTGKLDPVFSFDDNSFSKDSTSYKKSPLFDFFNKNLNDQNTDAVLAGNELLKFRQNLANRYLDKKSCSMTMHLTEMCLGAHEISQGKIIAIDKKIAGHLLNVSLEKSIAETKDHFGDQSTQFFANEKNLKEDQFKVLLETQRCKAFGFMSPVEGQAYSNIGRDIENDFNNIFTTKSIEPSSRFNAEMTLNRNKTNESILFENETDQKKPVVSSELSENTFSKKNQIESSSNLSAETPSIANTNFISTKSQLASAANNPEVSKNESIDSKNDIFAEKINDLTKKLSKSEENLDDLKNKKLQDEQKSDFQIKLAEQNKQISDLKIQISDLKKISNHNTLNKNKEQDYNSTQTLLPGHNSSFTRSNNQSITTTDSGSNNSGNTTFQPTVSIPKVMPQSQPKIAIGEESQISNIGSDIKTAGLILLKKGDFSQEKTAEVINDKILELKGVPFLIEENGIINEIIPILKDGKIVVDNNGNPSFKKIKKGKIGEINFKKINEQDGNVKIISNADMKRDQDVKLKNERIEYYKLKEITKGIFNSK